MRDVTPSKPAVLEIPDDEVPPKQLKDPTPEAETDEPLSDDDGFIAKLEEDLALCTSAEELAEIADANADMISRLPKEQKAKAAAMLKEAAE